MTEHTAQLLPKAWNSSSSSTALSCFFSEGFESFEALVINLDGPKRLPCDTSDFVTFGAAISRNASVCRSVRCPGAEAETLRHGVLQVELPGRVVAAKVLHNQESKAQLLEPGFGEKEDTVVALCWETVALGTVLSFGRNCF